MATVIVGVGVVSMLQLFAVCTQQNRAASRLTVAMTLAAGVQEMIEGLPMSDPGALLPAFGPEPGETLATFDDVDDFHAWSASPPVDALRRPIPELTRFRQSVTVTPVDPNRPSLVVPSSDVWRVTAVVSYAGDDGTFSPVYELSWLRVRS